MGVSACKTENFLPISENICQRKCTIYCNCGLAYTMLTFSSQSQDVTLPEQLIEQKCIFFKSIFKNLKRNVYTLTLLLITLHDYNFFMNSQNNFSNKMLSDPFLALPLDESSIYYIST